MTAYLGRHWPKLRYLLSIIIHLVYSNRNNYNSLPYNPWMKNGYSKHKNRLYDFYKAIGHEWIKWPLFSLRCGGWWLTGLQVVRRDRVRRWWSPQIKCGSKILIGYQVGDVKLKTKLNGESREDTDSNDCGNERGRGDRSPVVFRRSHRSHWTVELRFYNIITTINPIILESLLVR